MGIKKEKRSRLVLILIKAGKFAFKTVLNRMSDKYHSKPSILIFLNTKKISI